MKLIKIIKAIFCFFLFISLFYFLYRDSNVYPFQEDEHEFIRRGKYFELFINGDFKNPLWQGYESYDQPKLPEYFYGLALHLHGNKDISKYLQVVDFEQRILGAKTEKWWIKYSRRVQINIDSLPVSIQEKLRPIVQARKVTVIFSFGSLIIIFLIAFQIRGWLMGVISLVLLWLHPLFQLTSKRAMAEAPFLFFLLLGLFFSFWFLDSLYKSQAKRLLLFSLLIGLVSGLATASKLNGGMVLIYFLLLFLLIFLFTTFYFLQDIRSNLSSKGKIGSTLSVSVAIIFFLSFLSFVFLNPFTWSNPWKKSLFMISHRITTAKYQQMTFSEDALRSIDRRIIAVFKEVFLPSGDWHIFKTKNFPLDLTLFLIGFVFLIRSFYRNFSQNKKLDRSFLILLWTIVIFTCVMIYIPLNWDRYYLPLVPCIVIVQAYAICRIGKFILV